MAIPKAATNSNKRIHPHTEAINGTEKCGGSGISGGGESNNWCPTNIKMVKSLN